MVIKLHGGLEYPDLEAPMDHWDPLRFTHRGNQDLNMFKRYYPQRGYIPTTGRGGSLFDNEETSSDTLRGMTSHSHDDVMEVPIEVLTAEQCVRQRSASDVRTAHDGGAINSSLPRSMNVVNINGEDDADRKYQPPSQWIPELNLTSRDKVELMDGDMLTDKHIYAGQALLHKQYPNVSGFQDTCLSQIKFEPVPVDPLSIQIHHTRGHHWAVSAALEGHVYVFDTLYDDLSPDMKKQLLEVYTEYRDEQGDLTVILPDVQLQIGVIDCGLFAIAIAYDLCCGRNIESISHDQAVIRQHLLLCFEEQRITRFPHSLRSRRSPGNVEIVEGS